MLYLVLLIIATAAQAETYKWTDNDGTVHFSESIVEIPANYRKNAEPLGINTNDNTNKKKALSPAEPRQSSDEQGSVAPQMEGVRDQMLKDEGIMALIGAMQGDPEMQVLLNDPAIISAVQSGDFGILVNNPDFLKLLNNPRVLEIEKKMQNNKTR